MPSAAPSAASFGYRPNPAALFAKPGSPNAIWNTPIPAGRTYGAASPFAPGTVCGLAVWDGLYLSRSRATTSDPLVNLLRADTWGQVDTQAWKRSGNTTAVENAIRAAASNKFFGGGAAGARDRFYYHTATPGGYSLPAFPTFQPVEDPSGTPARQIRVPANRPLLADYDTDGHMMFMQPDGRVVETYSTIVMANGDIVAASYAVYRADAMLDGTFGGMTASMIPVAAGVITNAEANAATLSPTGAAIPHALAMLVPEAYLQRAAAYPAFTWDRNDVGYATAAAPFPMGARLAIPPGVDLAAARTFDTPIGAAIARAAQVYGIFVMDRGGGACAIRTEHPGGAEARGIAHPYPSVGDAVFNDNNWTLDQCRVVT